MRIFSTHVAVMGPDFRPVAFSPGDELPEWAVDLVGDHCLTNAESVEVAPEPDVDPEPAEVPAPAAAPDFTAPAKPRGRTPRGK